ncbi:DUF6344 domain-containing protein [Streptomyces sp. PSKA30]|uniref:DUF6344 domain-containing protein n=1 Tax=Streptomyces sp. PSKA30 TaxID=2874597 RepID=UPI001CD0AD8B|nr:DUF6344 domain-containing protein [Streptomyces sp. PSKA30]MBZ9639880.1 DUF6344 domain-containing protein [Streptomyces sp. PSKA30]
MARNKVMKLWNVIITAFLALCTALGLATTTAGAAVPQTEASRNSTARPNTAPTMSRWARPHATALPPTMKQRIQAEAHGKAPTCRHRPLTKTDTDQTGADPKAGDCGSRTSAPDDPVTLPLSSVPFP